MEDFEQEVVNTGSSLKDIEQADLIEGQCKIYRKELRKRERERGQLSDKEFNRAKVLCGKWMFLNLGIKTKVGIPVKILKMLERFPEIGKDLTGLGFLKDDSWDKEWPFGIVKVKHHNPLSFKRVSVNKIVQMSCAACHTGQLSDGRYSIGASNETLDYGKFNVYTLYSIWLVDSKKYNQERWLPELIEKYKKLREEGVTSFEKSLAMFSYLPVNGFVLKHLVGEEPPPLETQRSFIYSKPGVYNGFAPSLNFEDRQIFLTAPQLYEMSADEAHFGSLAGLEDLDDFVDEALVFSTRTKRYSKEKYIEPLREYMYCLKAPKPIKAAANPDLVEEGRNVFARSCVQCHDLDNGAGSKPVELSVMDAPTTYLELFNAYEPTEIQSRRTYRVIEQLELNKSATKLKVRRLKGIWTRQNLTSNGQIDGLDHLFCLDDKKREKQDVSDPKTQGIHADLCNNYSIDERMALKNYLETL